MNHHYMAISRRFRPQTFDQIVGQEVAVTSLQNALKLKRISHAYLFSGTRGCGKTTLARVFAKALTCQAHLEKPEPCNSCEQCRAIDQSRSMEVVEIDGASNRGIDDIRKLCENVGYSAGIGNWRIYIIDEVHMLTKEAFNALLKTLEDPPERVVFLLATTDVHRIPLTIQSRCQRFALNLVDVELIELKLRHILNKSSVEYDENALALIATAAEGSMRDAESLLDQVLCLSNESLKTDHVQSALGLIDANWFFKLDECMRSRDIGRVFILAKELVFAGIDLMSICSQLTKHFRNHLLVVIFEKKTCGREIMQLPKALNDSYFQRSGLYNQEQCLRILEIIKQNQWGLKNSAYSRVHIEMVLIEIVKSLDFISLSAMWHRLNQIQNALVESPNLPAQPPSYEYTTSDLDEKKIQEKLPGEIHDQTDASVPTTSPTFSPLSTQSDQVSSKCDVPASSDQNKARGSDSDFYKSLSAPRRDTLLHFARVEFGGQIDIK